MTDLGAIREHVMLLQQTLDRQRQMRAAFDRDRLGACDHQAIDALVAGHAAVTGSLLALARYIVERDTETSDAQAKDQTS